MTIRSTYALDPQTVRTLEQIARRWGVSKSEALRRAIRGAAGKTTGEQPDALEALSQLQQSLGLSRAAGRLWQQQARSARRAYSARMEKRGA